MLRSPLHTGPIRRRGLTLLETLVALSVLASSIVGITAAISNSSRLAWSSIKGQQALGIAQNRLAEVVAEAEPSPVSIEDEVEGYTLSTAYAAREHGLVLATVRVVWLDRGVERELSLSEVYVPRTVLEGGGE